jgi:L-rhamnose-H+ transport protein
MDTTFLGMIVFALGGLAGATFLIPARGIRGWAYETWWFWYVFLGLIVCPPIICYFTVPDFFAVTFSASPAVLLRCAGFGMMWGVGALAWGLMVRYLGIGLGLAIGCGLCSATGTLIPPIVTGRAGDLVKDLPAVVTLASVVISLVGIVLVGLAGKFKEGELDAEAKKRAVAEFNFKKGMVVALFSGIASAGMNFGLQGGEALAKAAAASGVDAKWTGMPVLVAVLWGGFVVNAAWCLWQNAKNRSFADYSKPCNAWFLASLAGVVWAMQFACQKVGEPAMGEMSYISFAVVMGSCVLFSSLLGVFLGEWKGTGAKTRLALVSGLVVLALSIATAVAAKTM